MSSEGKVHPVASNGDLTKKPFKIFVGYDPREDLAYEVCRHSILKRSSIPVEIVPIKQSELRKNGLYWRERGQFESTEFSFTRFLTPHLSNYDGWAMFVDCDFLYLADIKELTDLIDDKYAIMCVQHDYTPKETTKMDGAVQTVYPRKNWSSMVLYNSGHPKNKVLTPEVVNKETGAFLHRFQWLEDDDIGSIPFVWNFLEGHNQVVENDPSTFPKSIHYTRGGPWFEAWKHCEFADLWLKEMEEYNQEAQKKGVEVKSGESVVVEPGTTLVHLSQACLDVVKKGKGSDSISLFVKISDQKLVIGHLYAEKIPQLYFDLVFNKKFVLSHDGKSGSVHIHGYIANTGTFGTAEPKVSLEEAKNEIKSDQKDSSSDDDDDESEDEEFDQVKSVEDGSEDDDQSSDDDDDSDDEDDDSEEEHEETPNKVEGSNKHAAESSKTPVQKKAKFVTPEKTGGKKGAVHTATPYPSKQAVKKPANSDQTKQQSSNSSGIGAFRCNPCNRSFNSEGALQNHTKAKHGAAK